MCQFILPLWLSISGSHGPPPRVENVTSASKVEIPKSVERWFLDGGHALDSQCPHCRSHRENKRQIQKRTFSLSQGGRGNHVKRIFWVTSRASGYDGAESQSCFDLWDFFPSGCLPEQWKIIALTLEIFSEKTYLRKLSTRNLRVLRKSDEMLETAPSFCQLPFACIEHISFLD